MSDAVQLKRDGALAIVTVNRPQARNALDVPDMAAVGQAFARAEEEGARCVLVRGAGGAFCAGRDLQAVRPGEEDTQAILERAILPALGRVRRCGVPTIAAVEGPALGFGFGLALACDITLVADNARLGSPFRNIGLTLDSGGHHYLRERLGRHRAAELIFTGRLLTGREAARLGLVNRSVGALDLERESLRLAHSIAQGPTAAFRASKEILDCGEGYEAMAALESTHQAHLIAGTDGREGLAAFRAKRKPQFVGH